MVTQGKVTLLLEHVRASARLRPVGDLAGRQDLGIGALAGHALALRREGGTGCGMRGRRGHERLLLPRAGRDARATLPFGTVHVAVQTRAMKPG